MASARDSLIIGRLIGASLDQKAGGQPGRLGVWVERMLCAAGLGRGAFGRTIVVPAACAVAAWLVTGSVAATSCAAAGAFGAGTLAACRRASRRRDQLERDLPALLTSLASSVRAGIDPLTALSQSHLLLEDHSALGEQVAAFRSGLQAGEDEELLIAGFGQGDSTPDLELFKRCLLLSRRHGASLADPLHRVVRVVRQRQSFRRKTRAALAMHRMSAIGIALCALFVGGLQAAMNFAGIALTWAHPVGSKLLLAGAALIAVGIGWMMLLGREEAL